MKKADVIRVIGSQAKLSRLLGISKQAVSKWGETVPILRQYQLHALRPRLFTRPIK